MDILHFQDRGSVSTPGRLDHLPAEGMLWVDFVRGADQDWPGLVKHLTGVAIHERHLHDADNLQHPSYYDATSE